ncbi:hypothetical protein Tdes44962_MAKER10404 [Teratosphaeria destructans]|uniref:Uncharacterized protein n=1 Tax=Teratosphaeria destructans TaxID=418781 RepID=A0A9W7SJD1_9PEZI|nr:hypothetical protein Tdes44962_MAKER10404 [Teratosphaeria destructans]
MIGSARLRAPRSPDRDRPRGLGRLAGHLAKGDRDLEALVRAVYVFSRYAGVRLVDGGVEELVAGLERETERVGALVRGLDLEAVGREVRRGLARVTGG